MTTSTMAPGHGAIGDRVWADANGDGIQDPERGRHCRRRLVNLYHGSQTIFGTGDDELGCTDTTDANGNYSSTTWPADAYVVRVTDTAGRLHADRRSRPLWRDRAVRRQRQPDHDTRSFLVQATSSSTPTSATIQTVTYARSATRSGSTLTATAPTSPMATTAMLARQRTTSMASTA